MNNPYENQVPSKTKEKEGEKLSFAEKQIRVEKKIEAIKKQSPDMSSDKIEEIASKEADNFVEVWGAVEKFGKKWYSIEGESKEKMAEWKNQITEILNTFGKENFTELTNIHLDKIPENIGEEIEKFGGSFDDEAKTLLSISLWLKREQGGKWAGHRKIIWKVLSKDSVRLSSLLEESGAPACIDTSFFTKALAEEFDIKGEVKKIPMSKSKVAPEKMSHFYFQSDSGKIVDYWWARNRDENKDTGGLKLTQDSYDKVIEERTVKNICGY